MALFPEVQARARAELDAVVGTERLPTFEDRDKLPYLNAVALEALRWHTVTPTGRVLADASVFISCASVLACFDISPHVKDGVPTPIDREQTTGTISHPNAFKCKIVPRSEKAVSLIQADEQL
ncbi:hypothetical protein PM082_020912 [Marasmius tenuissimus]|nr:hypothetical protein PM082_020912 [Marasmius tenuissimus]